MTPGHRTLLPPMPLQIPHQDSWFFVLWPRSAKESRYTGGEIMWWSATGHIVQGANWPAACGEMQNSFLWSLLVGTSGVRMYGNSVQCLWLLFFISEQISWLHSFYFFQVKFHTSDYSYLKNSFACFTLLTDFREKVHTSDSCDPFHRNSDWLGSLKFFKRRFTPQIHVIRLIAIITVNWLSSLKFFKRTFIPQIIF